MEEHEQELNEEAEQAEQPPKKKRRGLKITLSVVAIVLAAIIVFAIVWYCGASYPVFDDAVKEDAAIPYLKEGISPQGLCLLPENDEGYDYAMSGYMVDGSASRVCLIDAETDESKYVTVTLNGEELATHFGGITCTGEYLLVASEYDVIRLSLADVLAAEDGAGVAAVDGFQMEIAPAFCYYYENRLYVGEFYRAGNYETDESHHITQNGETNYAFIYVYDADESAEGGIASETPLQVISIRGLVQGVAVYGDTIVLSTSYGLAPSNLYFYDNILDDGTDETVSVGGADVPLYRLDSTNLKYELETPCMSEEIFIDDGNLYILYESLCNKYKYGVRVRIDRICVIALSDLL